MVECGHGNSTSGTGGALRGRWSNRIRSVDSAVQNDPFAPLVDRLLRDLAGCDLVAWNGRYFLDASFWGGKLTVHQLPSSQIHPVLPDEWL